MSGPIVLLTDFGARDPYVGVMKGIIAGLAPQAPVIDLCHEIPPQDVRAAAFQLRVSAPYFPDGSIFVCVIDPGVGGKRRLLWARTGRHEFLAPDNGLLSWLADPIVELREAGNPRWRLPQVSGTFHGRDILAPAAARLWLGAERSQLGPIAKSSAPMPFPGVAVFRRGARGEVLYVDRYGNAITNLQAAHVGRGARVYFGERNLGGCGTHYASRPVGEAVPVMGSAGFLELAVRNGRFADVFAARAGDRVEARR